MGLRAVGDRRQLLEAEGGIIPVGISRSIWGRTEFWLLPRSLYELRVIDLYCGCLWVHSAGTDFGSWR